MKDVKEYYFHDKIIKDIHIKSNKDFMDEIVICLLDSNDKIIQLICLDCIICNIIGRGWITGKDSICEWVFKEGEEIKDLIPSFLGEKNRKEFKYLLLNFSISNTTCEIVAKSMIVHD